MADAMEMMLLSLLTPALICEWGISSFEQVEIKDQITKHKVQRPIIHSSGTRNHMRLLRYDAVIDVLGSNL